MKREKGQQLLMSRNDDEFTHIHQTTKKPLPFISYYRHYLLRYKNMIMIFLQRNINIIATLYNNDHDKNINKNKKNCTNNKYRYRTIIMIMIYILILLTCICFMSGCIIPMIIFHNHHQNWNIQSSSFFFSSQLLLFSSLFSYENNYYHFQTATTTTRTLTSIKSYKLPTLAQEQQHSESFMKHFPTIIYFYAYDDKIGHNINIVNNNNNINNNRTRRDIIHYYDMVHNDDVRYTNQPIRITIDVKGQRQNYGNINIKIGTTNNNNNHTYHYHDNHHSTPVVIDSKYDYRVYERMKSRLIHKMNHDRDMDETFYCRPEEVDSLSTSDCISFNWHHDSYPNCNQFHEISMSLYHPSSSSSYHKYAENNHHNNHEYNHEYNMTLLGRGAYRSAYLLRHPIIMNDVKEDEIVWKQLTYYDELNFNYKDIYKVRIEALIMERLTTSSNIANIYGYCSVSSLVEYGEELTYEIVPNLSYQKERGRTSTKLYNQLEQQYYYNEQKHNSTDNNTIFSFNNFTSIEKLYIIISMTEAIAEMHGYQYGVMVNDDIHPDQWLISKNNKDGKVRYILNDMNNAVFLQYNQYKQQYCSYSISYGGDFRSPEEYGDGSYVLESVDIWPIGNLIYILLTGLYPYYHLLHKDRKILQHLELNGIAPYISPKFSQNYNSIEYHLVSIMNTTFIRQPNLRPTIFDIIQKLYDIKEKYI